MNFVALIVHGLSAIAVFNDVLFVRLLVSSLIVSVLPIGMMLIITITKVFTMLPFRAGQQRRRAFLSCICSSS